MNTYLIIYNPNTGFAELANFGFVTAKTKEEAETKAKKLFYTTAKIQVVNVEDLYDGWTYYE